MSWQVVFISHTFARKSEGTHHCVGEGILCGVMKLKNLMFAKGREYENMLSQENSEFQPI